MIELSFDKGTLLLNGLEEDHKALLPDVAWDRRVKAWRAPAIAYRDCVLGLREHQLEYRDNARSFKPLKLPIVEELTPRSYQQEAPMHYHFRLTVCALHLA